MADDNNLPKPITMTGSDFKDVEKKEDPFEKKDETPKADPGDLPMPAVFGETDEDNKVDETKLPTPTPVVASDDNSDDTSEPEEEGEAEPIPEPEEIKPEPKPEPIKPAEEVESIPEPELPSQPELSQEPESIPEPEPIAEKTEKLEEVEDILEKVEPEEQSEEETSDPDLESIPEPEPEEIKSLEEVHKQEEPKEAEDKTKLPDVKVADINKEEDLDLPDNKSDDENDLNIPSIDPVVMSDADIEENEKEKEEMSNQDNLENPYTEKNIAEAQDLNVKKSKEVVHQIAQMNEEVKKRSTTSKVMTAALSLFVGGGLVVGGYFAAQNFFNPGGRESQVLYQDPDVNVVEPVTEEEPPQEIEEEVESSPSPTPEAEDEVKEEAEEETKEEVKDSDDDLITSTKYTYVKIEETPTDWLNTRSTPTTKEDNVIEKVYPDDVFEYLGANEIGWFKIKLDDGQEVWISGKYAQRLTQEEYDSLSDESEDEEEEEVTEEETEEPLEEE